MDFFQVITTISYWLLITMWLFVFIFYFRRIIDQKERSLHFVLLIILTIDAFRTLFESSYYGFWYTSLMGILPIEIYNFLQTPYLFVIPKLINVFSVILVILILLRRWIPNEESERKQQEKYLSSLEKEIDQREEKEIKLTHLATTDPLTGILNRRSFLELSQNLLKQSLEENKPISVLMMDIDNFKTINDELGHSVGDEVLISFVKECSSLLRSHDIIGRLGGDEFSIVLFNVTTEIACDIAERMTSHNFNLTLESGSNLHVSSSIGVASSDPEISSIEALINNADMALLEAKRRGRCKVHCFNDL